MQKVFNVAVDIGRKLPAPAFEVNTNDLKSVKLLITITNGQTLLDLTDTTVRIAIRKPDNNILFQDCTIKDAKTGQVEIVLENQAYIMAGTHTAEIMCYKGSDVVAVSGTFSYKSTKGIMNDEAVESKSEFTTITGMLKDVQDTIEDFRENGTGIDTKARQDIQSVTTQLADTVKEVNGVKPTNGKITLPIPQVDTTNLRLKTEKISQSDVSEELLQQMAGDTPINAVPADRSITLKKTTFTKPGKNLFNKNEVELDVALIPSTGQTTANTSFAVSLFIPVSPNTTYTKVGGWAYACYDSSRSYLKGGSESTFTTPANTAYIRIAVTKSSLNTMQVEKGSVATSYEEYRDFIDKEYVEKHPIGITDLPDIPPSKLSPISINKLDFTVQGSNLFDKSKVIRDSYIVGTNGVLTASAGFFASDFIPVSPNTIYTIKVLRHIAFYTAEKTYISGSNNSATENFQTTTPSNAAFVRFSWYKSELGSPDYQQMNLGNELLPFEVFGYKIPSDFVEANSGSSNDIVRKAILPPKIYAVVGQEINIYFENILNVPSKDLFIDVSCTIGKHEERRWTVIPTASGTFPLTVTLYKDYIPLKQTTTSIVVKSSNVGGNARNALIIGDSTINNQYMIDALLTKVASDPIDVTLYGTRGTGASKHEGRGGWTAAKYRTGDAYADGVVNPFYNPTSKDFDFGYYMTNQNYPALDYAGLCLGINDTFSFTTDEELLTEIPKILSNLDFMINSIKSYGANIKVGIFETIPPNESQNAFGAAYGNGQTQWRYKRNNSIWIEELIKHYKDKESQGIYIIPDNPNIDAKNGYADGVHPNAETGDKQRANTLFYWLKSFEV